MDARRGREFPVDLVHVLAHQAVHLGAAGEVGESRVGNAAALRPLSGVLHVDRDHGGDERGPGSPEDHRLADVGAEFELVLDELRREVAPVRELHHVGQAIDHHQMAGVVEVAGVARVQPAVLERLRRRRGVPEVALEHRGAPAEDLALVRNADLGAGQRHAHRLETDVSVPVHHRDPGHLGLAVELLQVHADGVVEAEDVGAERRAPGVGPPHVGEPQLVADGTEHRPVGEPVADLPGEADPAAPDAVLGAGGALPHRPAVDPALEAGRVFGHDLHVRNQVLPDPGRRHQERRPDLARVLARGRRLLREAHRESRQQTAGHSHHLFADPRKRQERHELVVRVHRVHALQLRRHGEQVLVREHRQLRDARRAGGRREQRDVAGPDPGQPAVELAGQPLMERIAECFDLLEGDQARRLVGVHAAAVVVDDVFEPGEPFPHFQHLVHLLLVLGHDHARLGDLQNAGELVGDGVLVEAQGKDAGGLGGQLRDHPLRPVVSDDRDPVARFHTQLRKPERETPHPRQVPGPGDLLPDPELLLAQRNAVGTVRRVVREEPWQGPGHGASPRRPGSSARVPR